MRISSSFCLRDGTLAVDLAGEMGVLGCRDGFLAICEAAVRQDASTVIVNKAYVTRQAGLSLERVAGEETEIAQLLRSSGIRTLVIQHGPMQEHSRRIVDAAQALGLEAVFVGEGSG